MAIKISLSSGTLATDSLLIPDLEGIKKIARGDLGIADTIKKNFMFGRIAASGLDEEAMSIFLKSGGVTTTKDLASYKDKDTGRLKIPINDISSNPVNDKLGLKSLEKTVFQSVFETQKPYLEAMMLVSESMVDFEDIIARLSGVVSLDGLSLRPNRNTNSLFSKLNSIENDINKIRNLSKDRKVGSKFSKLTTTQKQSGIRLDVINIQNPPNNKVTLSNKSDDTFVWEIIGTEYSTGVKIDGINYETIYKDIINNDLILDSSIKLPNPKKYGKEIPIEDEKPPTIVFAHFDNDGNVDDINHYKWKEWLNRTYTDGSVGPGTTKWYGEWEQLNRNNKGRYESYIRDYVKNRLTKKNNGRVPDKSVINDVYNFIKKKIDVQDIIDKGNEYCFMNLINITDPELGLNIGSDSSNDVGKVTNNRRQMFLPRKINYKGKEVFIDPEADYYLQIIKLEPTYYVGYKDKADTYNQQFKRTTPIAGNYQGVNVRDVLNREDYSNSFLNDGYNIRVRGESRRVQNIPKFLLDENHTTSTQFHDKTPTYIIEGVRREKPKSNKPEVIKPETPEDNNKKYYKRAHFFSAIAKFIDSIIDIALDLLPQLKDVYKLFSKPHEFLFDIILEKVGDNFELLSNEIIDKFSEANSINDIYEKVSFVRGEPMLKKFVFIDETTGKMKFLFDSVGMFDLMGFNFGVQLTNLIPKFVIGSNGRNKDDLTSSKKSVNGNFNDELIGDIRKAKGSTGSKTSDIENGNLNNRADDPSVDSNSIGFENISIKYSTGEKIEGIDYEFIYITQDVEKLIRRGDELFNIAAMSDINQDLDSAIGALQNYDQALEKDPNNQAIKDKINELKGKFRVQLNMIFKFLFNLVSMPIKIAKNVLGKVLDLFDSITLETVESEIPEFLKFEWILDNFKPDFILSLLGIRFNPSLLVEWLSKSKNGDYNKEHKFNLDQVMAIPFLQQLPEVNIDELLVITKKPLSVLTQLFKFVEQMVTGIIQFILDIINIDKVIKVPEFNISKFIDGNLSIAELQKLLNGEGNDILNNSTDISGSNINIPSSNFLYDIKLPNGEVIKGLNRVELDSYIEANSSLQYEFSFPEN